MNRHKWRHLLRFLPCSSNRNQSNPLSLEDKLKRIPTIYGVPGRGKKTGIPLFNYYFLINKGTKPSRSRRPRYVYPVDESPIKPIPDDIGQALTRNAVKRYKPPYTLHRLYEHDDDPLLFLWTNAVVHPTTLTPEFPASLRRYNKTVRVNTLQPPVLREVSGGTVVASQWCRSTSRSRKIM